MCFIGFFLFFIFSVGRRRGGRRREQGKAKEGGWSKTSRKLVLCFAVFILSIASSSEPLPYFWVGGLFFFLIFRLFFLFFPFLCFPQCSRINSQARPEKNQDSAKQPKLRWTQDKNKDI
jgi:cytochrome bd-type quinol oxidase subunit 2